MNRQAKLHKLGVEKPLAKIVQKSLTNGKGQPDIAFGQIGDLYIDTENVAVYGPKTDLGWGNPINLRGSVGAGGSMGPQGPQGDTGPIGPTGATGATGSNGAPGATGATGAKGDTGAQGIQGDQGIQGVTGATGSTGSQGIQGIPGIDGATWTTGSGVPSNGSGFNNDLYLRTTNGDVYKKSAGTWSVIANIIGPTGLTGNTGSTGPAGPGLAAGGTTGQYAIKNSNADYDTSWHTLVKSDVSLGNVDNTSDANKPVSAAQQTAIDAKVADAINDGITTIAPSENAVFDALGLKAPLASPALTGSPTAPTQSSGDNSTKIATDAFVTTAIANAIAAVNPAVAVQAATTSAANTSGLTYNNGASGIGATLTGLPNTAVTWDGYTFTALGQRGLVKNDTQSPSGAFNGVYYVTQVQTAILPLILTRALDYDMPSDINNTGAIPVVNGTVNGSTTWVLTSAVATIGTDPLTFTEFSLNPAVLITTSTSAGGDLTGTYPNPSLKNTGPGAIGPIGSATNVAVVTIDVQGRTTALTSAAIQITEAQVTNLVADLAAVAPVPQRPTAGYTVRANTQILFFTNIDMTAANGDLTINGLLQGVK